MARGYKTVAVRLSDTDLVLYGSSSLLNAVQTIIDSEDMTFYKGVKLTQILEAVYQQGKKDGARAVFDRVEGDLLAAMKEIPHRNPGRPPKVK